MKTVYFLLLFLFLLFCSAEAQVGIGTLNPSSSAILDLTSLNKALILPRMNQAQINAIAAPVNGMIVFCTNGGGTGGCVQIYEDDRWHCINEQKIWFNTCNVPMVYYETYFGGKVWLDRNIGAKTIPTSVSDDLGYGSLFQWGRLGGASSHHCVDWSATPPTLSATTTTQIVNTSVSDNFVISNHDWATVNDDNLWTVGQTPDNNPCPSGYRVPTQAEMQNAIEASGSTAADITANILHIPPAGYRRWSDGVLLNTGLDFYYWTREAGTGTPGDAIFFFWSVGSQGGLETYKAQGMSVRCVKQ